MNESAANFRSQQISGEIELIERLKNAARVSASWDVVYRPSSPGSFPSRTRAASRALAQLEKELYGPGAKHAMKDPRLKSSRSALLVLRDHDRQLRTALSAVSARPKMIARLPRVLSSAGHDEPRVAAIAHIYLDIVNGDFNTSTFAAFVDALQEHEPLTLDELWSVSAFLRFALLESLLHDAQTLMYSAKENSVPNFSIRLGSLRTINLSDWAILIEPLILFDRLLYQDPAQTYGKMDFESRQLYRKRIAFIARHSDCTETEVAQVALDLARDGFEPGVQASSHAPTPKTVISAVSCYFRFSFSPLPSFLRYRNSPRLFRW